MPGKVFGLVDMEDDANKFKDARRLLSRRRKAGFKKAR
jgi:hypothetical protein